MRVFGGFERPSNPWTGEPNKPRAAAGGACAPPPIARSLVGGRTESDALGSWERLGIHRGGGRFGQPGRRNSSDALRTKLLCRALCWWHPRSARPVRAAGWARKVAPAGRLVVGLHVSIRATGPDVRRGSASTPSGLIEEPSHPPSHTGDRIGRCAPLAPSTERQYRWRRRG